MESKFVQLVGESYKVVRGFFPTEECDAYAAKFREDYIEEGLEYVDADVAGYSLGIHQHTPAQLYLVNNNQKVTEILGENTLPTYAYTRSYGNGGYLTRHKDRLACEISVTVHLDGDQPWEFEIFNVEGETDTIVLEKGDAILFDGCTFRHNRVGDYAGEEYVQLFLHYIFAEGDNTEQAFDYYNQERVCGARHTYIHIEKGFIGSSECDGIVNCAKDIDSWKTAGTAGEETPGETGYRVCESLFTAEHKELDQILFTYVSRLISTYRAKYPSCNVTTDEGYNILKYTPGGKYDNHCDQGEDHNRALTIIFNLNDDYEGGLLTFFKNRYAVKLEKGDAIIFPASFMFDHQIHPITDGVRYSMVTWAV